MKPVRFIGSTLRDLRRFPEKARRTAGFELHRVQTGKQPRDFRAMPDVGRGVYEIRIREEDHAHRVFYVARFDDAIYVLHAFEKKTRRTPRADLETARRRYREIIEMRST